MEIYFIIKQYIVTYFYRFFYSAINHGIPYLPLLHLLSFFVFFSRHVAFCHYFHYFFLQKKPSDTFMFVCIYV